jgi:ADP-ribose pyrophosphatase YjhB (NUDIX family)
MRTMRNLRIVIAIGNNGRWLLVRDGALFVLPAGHVREGETTRYALSRIARDLLDADVRMVDIATVAEREGRRSSELCIELYVRAALLDEEPQSELRWATADELRDSGVAPGVVGALQNALGCPYLGIAHRTPLPSSSTS